MKNKTTKKYQKNHTRYLKHRAEKLAYAKGYYRKYRANHFGFCANDTGLPAAEAMSAKIKTCEDIGL